MKVVDATMREWPNLKLHEQFKLNKDNNDYVTNSERGFQNIPEQTWGWKKEYYISKSKNKKTKKNIGHKYI